MRLVVLRPGSPKRIQKNSKTMNENQPRQETSYTKMQTRSNETGGPNPTKKVSARATRFCALPPQGANSSFPALLVACLFLATWGFNAAAALPTNILEGGPAPAANFELLQSVQDDSRRVWALGAFSNSITLGTNTLTSQGERDLLLAQYSPAGSLNWIATMGSISDDAQSANGDAPPSSAKMAVRGGVCVVTGLEHQSMRVVDAPKNVYMTPFNPGNKPTGCDGFLLKFDAAGQLSWQAAVTSASGSDFGASATVDVNGNVLWAAGFNGCCPSMGSATIVDGIGTFSNVTTPA